jgi:hypothetical protein
MSLNILRQTYGTLKKVDRAVEARDQYAVISDLCVETCYRQHTFIRSRAFAMRLCH